MPMRHHLFVNGNITFLLEHGNDEIKKVYFRFQGTYEYIPIPNVTTHNPPNLIKYTEFQFGNLYFQVLHERDTIVLVRFKYLQHDQFYHLTDLRSYEVDDDDTISQNP